MTQTPTCNEKEQMCPKQMFNVIYKQWISAWNKWMEQTNCANDAFGIEYFYHDR